MKLGAGIARKFCSNEFPFDAPVQPGETLFGIAEKYYGDGYKWMQLKEHNPWINPDRLIVGRKIYVPNPTSQSGGGSGGS